MRQNLRRCAPTALATMSGMDMLMPDSSESELEMPDNIDLTAQSSDDDILASVQRRVALASSDSDDDFVSHPTPRTRKPVGRGTFKGKGKGKGKGIGKRKGTRVGQASTEKREAVTAALVDDNSDSDGVIALLSPTSNSLTPSPAAPVPRARASKRGAPARRDSDGDSGNEAASADVGRGKRRRSVRTDVARMREEVLRELEEEEGGKPQAIAGVKPLPAPNAAVAVRHAAVSGRVLVRLARSSSCCVCLCSCARVPCLLCTRTS